MCKIISIANQKGGVGKTTTAFNLATALTVKDNKVLAIDFDPQSDLSKYADYDNNDDKPTMSDLLMGKVGIGKAVDIKDCIRHNKLKRIDYIPSDINLANADLILSGVLSRETILKRILKNEIVNQYDYVIIDCNPSLGVLLMNALATSTGVIIPVQTQDFAFDGLNTLTGVITQIQDTINSQLSIIGVLPTMVEHTNASKRVLEQLENIYKDKLFNIRIHKATQAVESTQLRKALCLIKNSKLGQEYLDLADEVISILA